MKVVAFGVSVIHLYFAVVVCSIAVIHFESLHLPTIVNVVAVVLL